MKKGDLGKRFNDLSKILLDELNENGFWTGRLSSSALAVSVSVAALYFDDPEIHKPEIDMGLTWLKNNINSDGSYGDTPASPGNISTSLLVYAAVNLYSKENESLKKLQSKISAYLQQNNIDIKSDRVADSILTHYKKDYTFSVPILTMSALCGIPEKDAFRKIPQLPFELALMPLKFYRILNLSVVSYAIPALIAVGIVIFKKKKSGFVFNWIRRSAENKALKILEKSLPESGGFLEAVPLTAFVVLSLIEAGHKSSKVVEDGLKFIKRTQRSDGGWPIDVDLSTWVTTLSIKALGDKRDELLRPEQLDIIKEHLISLQNKSVHIFNGSAPGGWGWTSFSGSVPDGDDTPGAILALLNMASPLSVKSEVLLGGKWLLKLQNKDGGFPTFSRGWGRLPFDQSCADLTGHAFLAIALILEKYKDSIPLSEKGKFERSLLKALAFLGKHQRKDGSWLPLWFGNQFTDNHENPVYGTARVLTYLNDSLSSLKEYRRIKLKVESLITGAEGFLLEVQNSDGSWGGNRGVSGTLEETSLAISALQKDEFKTIKEKGFIWLDDFYQSYGLNPSPIGLYFASLWYDEKLYPLTFYLEALRRNMAG